MLPRAHPNKPWATLEYRTAQQQRILRVMEFTGPEYDDALADALRKAGVPVLALFGSNDHFVFPSVALVYEQTIPGCQTRIVQGMTFPASFPRSMLRSSLTSCSVTLERPDLSVILPMQNGRVARSPS
jgi:hypothetical protein